MATTAHSRDRAGIAPVPVARRCCDRIEADSGRFLVTKARFPPNLALTKHVHDRTLVVVATEGGCTSTVRSATFEMSPGVAVVEPAGEVHENRFGVRGTAVIIMQPDTSDDEIFAPCVRFLTTPARICGESLASLARRMDRELAEPDTLSGLALEACALEFVTTAARTPPVLADRQWFRQLIDYMHSEFLGRPTIADLSAAAGIHPAHLAREFRRVHRVSPVAYLRRLRVQWATEQLRETETPISAIAAAAGFADQSHFTRVFRSIVGVTPARHRALTQNRPPRVL